MANNQPCEYCLNARSDPDCELDDSNDFGSMSISGMSEDGFRIMFDGGAGMPPRLVIEQRRPEYGWVNIGKYFPKFCPECGRDLMNDYPNYSYDLLNGKGNK